MEIPNENYFKTSNSIFSYGLKPVQLAVYSYLLCRAGRRGRCWPSMKNIAQSVNCSVNTARSAIDALCRLEFIRKVDTFQTVRSDRSRRSNNTYYILDLPQLPEVGSAIGSITGS